MAYECYVQFVPKGKPPREANNLKTLSFEHDSLHRSDIVSEAYRHADTRSGNVSAYSLRNHWEVFEVEVSFNNPPWEGFQELCAELMSYSEAQNWKSSGNSLFISVQSGSEQDYIQKVNNYYSGLNPRKQSQKIVAVDTQPVLRN